jgi:hypothetical protein
VRRFAAQVCVCTRYSSYHVTCSVRRHCDCAEYVRMEEYLQRCLVAVRRGSVGVIVSWHFWGTVVLGRERTKETVNSNATAKPGLNTCYWMEQRKLRTLRCRLVSDICAGAILGNCGCQFSWCALALTDLSLRTGYLRRRHPNLLCIFPVLVCTAEARITQAV